MAIAYRSYSDIISEHLHMQIHENLATNTRTLSGKAKDGKSFMVGVDNSALAMSQDPQGIMYNAAAQLQNAINQHNQSLAGQWAHQQALQNQYAQGQQQYHNYLNQLAQAHPEIARPVKIIEEVEDEVVKEVYHAAFDLRRFLERVIHWPIDLIDWSVRWA